MNQLLNDENDLLAEREKELTLSTGSILGIFLGLVVLCGVFFGFGYNIGRRSAAPATPPSAAEAQGASGTSTAQSGPNFYAFKPAAGSPAAPTSTSTEEPAAATPANTPATTAAADSTPTETPATVRVLTPEAGAKSAAESATSTAAPAGAAQSGTPAPANGPVVQVAAVSHEQDATLLMNALRAKGYDVTARTEPQDKLIHIQVGPFANRKDADAMRQKLLADGYNAIVK